MEVIETHENCDCIVVHPNGQLQIIKECWCKAYHAFGKNIQLEEVMESQVMDDIYCYYLKNNKSNLPPNPFLGRKLQRNIFGPGIFFQKGSDLQVEKAKTLLHH
jgi:hypothetical protein